MKKKKVIKADRFNFVHFLGGSLAGGDRVAKLVDKRVVFLQPVQQGDKIVAWLVRPHV